ISMPQKFVTGNNYVSTTIPRPPGDGSNANLGLFSNVQSYSQNSKGGDPTALELNYHNSDDNISNHYHSANSTDTISGSSRLSQRFYDRRKHESKNNRDWEINRSNQFRNDSNRTYFKHDTNRNSESGTAMPILSMDKPNASATAINARVTLINTNPQRTAGPMDNNKLNLSSNPTDLSMTIPLMTHPSGNVTEHNDDANIDTMQPISGNKTRRMFENETMNLENYLCAIGATRRKDEMYGTYTYLTPKFVNQMRPFLKNLRCKKKDMLPSLPTRNPPRHPDLIEWERFLEEKQNNKKCKQKCSEHRSFANSHLHSERTHRHEYNYRDNYNYGQQKDRERAKNKGYFKTSRLYIHYKTDTKNPEREEPTDADMHVDKTNEINDEQKNWQDQVTTSEYHIVSNPHQNHLEKRLPTSEFATSAIKTKSADTKQHSLPTKANDQDNDPVGDNSPQTHKKAKRQRKNKGKKKTVAQQQ
ncbi:hypothetical protein RFI_12056, partial [Reticulomyxa filosa]